MRVLTAQVDGVTVDLSGQVTGCVIPDLQAALDLRSRIGAPVDQLRSTRAALRRVRADLDPHSGPTRPGQ